MDEKQEQDYLMPETSPQYEHLLGQRVGIKNKDPKEHLLYTDASIKHV